MDSGSNLNSFEALLLPKLEMDLDNENEQDRKEPKFYWNSENTLKLINVFEKECRVLWDGKHPLNKSKAARQAKSEYLGEVFGTSPEEINRKLHNLRTQYNNELRKIKRRQSPEGAALPASGWEYFEALSFIKLPPDDALDTSVDSVNLELAEFQADEEIEFGLKKAKHIAQNEEIQASQSQVSLICPLPKKPMLRVAASAPPPLPPSAHPLMWPEDTTPSIRPGINATDECQIFGDFVASELRILRSNESRKKLKRMIQKAILQIGEEEDVHMMG